MVRSPACFLTVAQLLSHPNIRTSNDSSCFCVREQNIWGGVEFQARFSFRAEKHSTISMSYLTVTLQTLPRPGEGGLEAGRYFHFLAWVSFQAVLQLPLGHHDNYRLPVLQNELQPCNPKHSTPLSCPHTSHQMGKKTTNGVIKSTMHEISQKVNDNILNCHYFPFSFIFESLENTHGVLKKKHHMGVQIQGSLDSRLCAGVLLHGLAQHCSMWHLGVCIIFFRRA